jgi:hypothetical protein
MKQLLGDSLTLRDYDGQVAGYGHGACVEQDDKGWDARKRAYCLKISQLQGRSHEILFIQQSPLRQRPRAGKPAYIPGDVSMTLRIMVADTCLSRFTNLLRCDLPCNSFPKLSMQNGQIREESATPKR